MKLNIKDIALLKSNPLEYYKKSYSHKPHLAGLPYDLNTNDPDKLKERLKACKDGLKEAEKELKDLQEFKGNVESVEQYNKEIQEKSEAKLNKIKEQWERVRNNPYYSEDIEEFVESGMEDFIDDMENNIGFIGKHDVTYHSTLPGDMDYAIPDYADGNYGYPSGGELHGFERFAEDHDTLERYVREYLREFNIDGDGEYAKEMKARTDKLPNDWEEKNNTINREIGKAETKVNDFKNHQQKIEEKLNNLKE